MKKKLEIVLFDIDNFKVVNDTKGHVFRDEVLTNMADIMERSVRETDTVGRYGGEEFLIVFPNTDVETAWAVAERIRHDIEEHNFGNMKITISDEWKIYSACYQFMNLLRIITKCTI